LRFDSLKTPLLLEEGSIDGNVNPFQSEGAVQFRARLGKQVVYLIYEDENHGVARPESQMDYHRRQLEWFNHFLKGEPAADWIVNGESYQARQKILNDARGEGGVPHSRQVDEADAQRPRVGWRETMKLTTHS
jgi:hypothetical protein